MKKIKINKECVREKIAGLNLETSLLYLSVSKTALAEDLRCSWVERDALLNHRTLCASLSDLADVVSTSMMCLLLWLLRGAALRRHNGAKMAPKWRQNGAETAIIAGPFSGER